jgi:Terminase large subunit, T4likevirus-type, N-terminal
MTNGALKPTSSAKTGDDVTVNNAKMSAGMFDRDFARACDPAILFKQGTGAPADPWQAKLLCKMLSGGKGPDRCLVVAPRQQGKSQTCATGALYTAIYRAPAKILIASPSIAQSLLMVATISRMAAKIPDVPSVESESEKRIRFSNGSEVIGIHSSEKTLRGHSAISQIILDESAVVDPDLIAALLPMLTISRGAFWAVSTPRGRANWFAEEWHNSNSHFEKIFVPISECPRLDAAAKKKLLDDLGPTAYSQEIDCNFLSDDSAAFDVNVINACLSADVKPLFAS